MIDVSGFGGLTKQYHVNVDPQRLNYYSVPLSTLISAIQNANVNAGGNYLNVGEQAFDVRGLGLITTLDDIRNDRSQLDQIDSDHGGQRGRRLSRVRSAAGDRRNE